MIDEFCLFFSYHRDLWMQTELVSLCAALSPPSVSTYQDTCETSPGWCIWLSNETPGCVAAWASRETAAHIRGNCGSAPPQFPRSGCARL